MNIENDNGKSFVFHPSFIDSVEALPEEMQLEALKAIISYGCREQVPENLSPIAKALFLAIKPNIDAADARYARKDKRGGNNKYGRAGKPAEQLTIAEEADEEDEPENRTEIEINRSFIEKNRTEIEINKREIENNRTEIEKIDEIETCKSAIIDKDKDKNKDKENNKENKNCSRSNACARAREEFLEDFFDESRSNAIAKQVDSLGVTHERYRQLVEQVLDDWEVNGAVPAPDDEMRMKMLNTVRKKHNAQRLQKTPKSAIDRRREELMAEQRNRERNAVYERQDYLSGEALARKLAQYSKPPTGYTPESALEEFRTRMAQ